MVAFVSMVALRSEVLRPLVSFPRDNFLFVNTNRMKNILGCAARVKNWLECIRVTIFRIFLFRAAMTNRVAII